MTTLLRQSGKLARVSKASLQTTTRSSLLTTHVVPTTVFSSRIAARSYATDPKKKNIKSQAQKKDESSNGVKKASDPPSKSAPGTENLYNQNSAVSPAPAGKESSTPLLEGMVKLSDEDVKGLENLLESLKQGLPKSQIAAVEQAFELIKSEGIPKEVREILDSVKEGKPMTVATAAKLTRLMSRYSLKAAEQNKGKNTDFSQNDPHGENGARMPPPPPPGDKSGKQQQQGRIPGMEGIKLDTNTLLLSAFVAYMTYSTLFPGENSKDITWQEFRTAFFDKGLVEKLTVVDGDRVRVDLHREQTATLYPESPATNPSFHYYFSIGSVEAFEKRLDQAHDELGIPSSERIPVSYVRGGSTWLSLLINLAPTVLFIGGLYWLSRSRAGAGGSSGVFGMMKNKAKQFNHETDVKVKFSDVAGMDEAKAEIMEFVSFLKSPDRYMRLGAKIPRGAILSGPPGTGKTLLAKATAGESGVPFFSVSGSEFVEMFVGVGASRVRDLFVMARKNTPCIIFIDEIDAIGKARGKGTGFGGNDEREATLNQILTEMDGFNTSEQVVVLAGTNRPDVLDKALTRPGRFDRHIAIDRPTMEGRKQIFAVHVGKIVTSENIDYLTGRLAALTPGFSGADVANCCNEAALIAARTNATAVEMKHFEQAIERVIGGLERKSLVLGAEERRVVAYHEAGHAICGWYFKYADPLLKVSIIPRGQGALGYAQYLPAGDTYLMNVNQLMDRMAMTLGGRVSEELHFETVTSGGSDDFNKVTRLATSMVTRWGMSKKLGPLHFEDNENQLHKPFAEATAQIIDSEVRRIVDEAYTQCKDLLTEKKAEVGLVAEELLKKEVLGRDDFVRLLGERPWGQSEEFTKYFDGGRKSAPPPPQTENTDSPTGPEPTLFKN